MGFGATVEKKKELRRGTRAGSIGIYCAGEALKDAHLRHTDKRDDAADRGTNVHDVVLHALATGSPVPDMPSLTPEERGFAQAVIGWWLDKRPEPLLAELVVADPDGLGVAGRLDLVAMIDGRRTLVDLKTSASGIRTTGHVQVAGYRHLLELSGFDPVERSVIVHARGDGSYYEAACEATTEGFLNAVAVYRDAARIKRCASAAERASA